MTRRSDGRWQQSITVNGKKVFFYGKTRQEVNQKILDYRAGLSDQSAFCQVAERWQTLHREEVSDRTWTNYKPHYDDIVERHGDKQVSDITALDIMTDLKRCAAQHRSATIISTRRSLYRMILDQALVEGLITHNPAIGIKMPKGAPKSRREAPTDEVLKIIWSNPDKPFALFPILLSMTGLRKSEALALTWGDIGPTHIRVTKALDYTVQSRPKVKQPKTKAGVRDVPIMDALRPYLIRPRGAADDDALFPGQPSHRNPHPGKYMAAQEYEGAWARYCASVGLVDDDGKPVITAHQLRHGMATIGFEAGVDELTMQAILGHASPTTTRDIYTHLRQKQKTASVSALNANLSKRMSE